MTRLKKGMTLAGSLLLLGAAGVSWWIWPTNGISKALAERVQRGPGTVIDLAEVAPFEWDRVCIFDCYSPDDTIDAELGAHWSDLHPTSIRSSDSVCLVAFVKGARVVAWLEHPRNQGDLSGVAHAKGYLRAEARFVVGETAARWLVLTKASK